MARKDHLLFLSPCLLLSQLQSLASAFQGQNEIRQQKLSGRAFSIAGWGGLSSIMFASNLKAVKMDTESCDTFATIARGIELGDVAVIGCGVLGTSFCKQLLELEQKTSPSLFKSLTGITKSSSRHEEISSTLGYSSKMKLSTFTEVISSGKFFDNILFCAPPSGSEDYPNDVKLAVSNLWTGSERPEGGAFVFTSSGGIYGGANRETVTESSPVDDTSPRSAKLIAAESECTSRGGTVLRLAGLYTLERGAHGYWFSDKMSGKEMRGPADGIINLLHYDDAAGSCLAAMLQANLHKEKIHGQTFLISDGNPTTRQGISESAMKHSLFSSKPMPKFGTGDGKAGKIYDGTKSNEILCWTPRYSSFDEFMLNQSGK